MNQYSESDVKAAWNAQNLLRYVEAEGISLDDAIVDDALNMWDEGIPQQQHINSWRSTIERGLEVLQAAHPYASAHYADGTAGDTEAYESLIKNPGRCAPVVYYSAGYTATNPRHAWITLVTRSH